MSSLLLLPPELLEQVFLNLSFRDLAVCCQVCTTLQVVAKELLPATHLILDSDGPSSESRRGHALGQYRCDFERREMKEETSSCPTQERPGR